MKKSHIVKYENPNSQILYTQMLNKPYLKELFKLMRINGLLISKFIIFYFDATFLRLEPFTLTISSPRENLPSLQLEKD